MTMVTYPSLNRIDEFPSELFNWFNRSSSTRRDNSWYPALDVQETEDAFELRLDVPGVEREKIDITLDDGVLRIEGSRELDRAEKTNDGLYRRYERTAGSFKRTVRMPVKAVSDDISATVKNGVLVITIKKQEEIKPKRIEVHS